jgi:Uma2 family endonuclease
MALEEATMTALARMTADEFLAWAMERPKGERYELVAGEVVAMAPERLAHAQVKYRITRAFDDALRARGLPCEALPDGIAVQIDETTVYEPDALARCGPDLPNDTVTLVDPVIVVEVLSPSSRAHDTGAKLADYFRLASVRHYLIVDTARQTVLHHRCEDGDRLQTLVLCAGALELDPFGIRVTIETFFP